MRRLLSTILLATMLLSGADANARPKRRHDSRWVGGLVVGITGTAVSVFTLGVLLITHTCFMGGGCAEGEKPPSESSAWPYVGVAGGFAAVGAVGWYLFATPNPPPPEADPIAIRRPVTFGVAPAPGGMRATFSMTF